MDWPIPGTVLTCPIEAASGLQARFEGMFLGGDISLSQVVAITGLESHTVQNWVKRGFLTPPVHKRYTLRQLCRILNIAMLRGVLPLDRICSLLGYVNGQLDDEGDDIIDDTQLYFLFLGLAAEADTLLRAHDRDALLDSAMESYAPPRAEDKARVKSALRIMLTAYLASRMQQQTELLLRNIL